MVQFFQTGPSRKSLMKTMLGQSIGEGLASFTNNYLANKSLEGVLNDKSLHDAPPEERVSALQRALEPYGETGLGILQRRMGIEQMREQRQQQQKEIAARKVLAKELGFSEDVAEGIPAETLINARKAMTPKPPKGGVTAQPMPKEVSDILFPILNANRDATSEELRQRFDDAGVPPVWSDRYVENREKQEEIKGKQQTRIQEQTRAETLPARKEYSEKAALARQGIENKERGLELVKRGNINDPTFAALAEALPLNLGKRLLSNDTVEYKAGLVDEFGDLRKIFQGQTRIKEIELLENKIPDIYLTDSQKEAILKSRINALKGDLIREEVAEEVERDMPNLGVLQYRKEVEKRAKPKLESLFNQILDQQKAIIQDAENKKKIPLDPSDPEDYKIMLQIKNEAKGDKKRAKEIARQRGYTVKGEK